MKLFILVKRDYKIIKNEDKSDKLILF